MSIEKCADSVFESVRAYLEKRLQELPAANDGIQGAIGPRGEKGLDGAPGAEGKPGEKGLDGANGRDGVDGAQGEKGRNGAPGADGKQGFNGMAGADGRDGVDGQQGEKGLDGAAGRDGIDGKDGQAGPEGPPGKDGAAGRDGVDGAKGVDGAQGQPGTDGMTGLTGTKGIDGEPGRDGRDGPPGRDAAQIDILPAINEERSYARGTWASHKGGIWRAMRATEGMDGWECLHVGLADIQIEVGDDGRTITTKHILSDGRVIAHTRKTVEAIFRGVFKDGEQYERGDTTTWSGSTWHCNEATADKPIEGGKAWTLMTKRGRDGKEGPAGKQGEKGLDGRAGRDLTQMMPSGMKY